MKTLSQAGEELAGCYFADNDHIAIGVSKALKEAGYKIPEDIAIVGFDALPLCEYITLPLTTIHVHIHHMGNVVTARLMQLIENIDKPPQ